jgi:NADH-quinone oxidoreductase subunit K
MLFIQLVVNIFLFNVSVFGLLFYTHNILFMLMCIELVLLSVNLTFVIFSLYLDDIYGQLFSFFILTVAAAESAIGLAIIIIYFRVNNHIQLDQNDIFRY